MENIINDMAIQRQYPVNPNNSNLLNLNLNETATPYKVSGRNRNDYDIIGICYVPMQQWEQIYDEDTAFSVGTLFPALNLPFLGGGK